MLNLFVLDFIPDISPLLFQFGQHGFFSQITNTVISLLIQTGPRFSNSADCSKAVSDVGVRKQWWEMAHRCCTHPWILSFIMVPHRYRPFSFIIFQIELLKNILNYNLIPTENIFLINRPFFVTWLSQKLGFYHVLGLQVINSEYFL